MVEGEIPAKMRALVLRDFQWTPESLAVDEVRVPRPGPGQVLVRMVAAPVNPSDLSYLYGRSVRPTSLPAIPGLEGSGRVAAVGPGVLGRWLVGRRVACAPSVGGGGTWAEYLVTSATRCVPLRRKVSLVSGASLIVNPLTAAALVKILQRGRHRAVVSNAAAGALGMMIGRLAAAEGIQLIQIVRSEAEVDKLRSLGADHVLNSTAASFDDELQARCLNLNATLALDAVAGPMTAQLLAALPRGGEVIVYGNLSRSDSQVSPHAMIRENKRLSGFYLSSWLAQEGKLRSFLLALQVQSHLNGVLRTKIRDRLSFKDAYEGINGYAQNMGRGKILIVPQRGEVNS